MADISRIKNIKENEVELLQLQRGTSTHLDDIKDVHSPGSITAECTSYDR